MKSFAKTALCLLVLQTVVGCASQQSAALSEKLTCEQHAEAAATLNTWAARNFDESYGKKGDAKGAQAQLFMIEQKAPFPYAESFNKNQKAAAMNINIAKKKGCDTSAYALAPVDEFRRRAEAARNAN